MSLHDKLLAVFVFLQFALPMIILGVMFKGRLKAVTNGDVPMGYFKNFKAQDGFSLPDYVQVPSRNFINLFEVPVLFFALVPLLFQFQFVDLWTVLLAGLFVLSRYVHSYIHVTHNKVMKRMRVYSFGLIVLCLLWLKFIIQILIQK